MHKGRELGDERELTDWNRVEAIVDSCLEMPGAERARFLVDRCGDDPSMLFSVLDLLFAAEEAESIRTPMWQPSAVDSSAAHEVEDPAAESRGPSQLPENRQPTRGHQPTRIEGRFAGDERFRVIEELGRGGMGVVYLAEQQEPVKRRLALKISRQRLGGAGRDEAEGRARLELERQIMARLAHPNIARVLEAGSTADGHPYFALEWVDGLPITTFCDRHGFDLGQRLELFQGACAGVQHAHRRGVLHRDLKPSNVLVTELDGRPIVKIIDFGIAKGLEEDGGVQGLTRGRIVGTPSYLSPESVRDADYVPDIRADIYGLGVLLYELILGQLPVPGNAGESPFEHLQRIERQRAEMGLRKGGLEMDPEARAKRLAVLGVSEASWQSRIGGELHWVVAKAIAEEPADRYGAASELADELQRLLDNRPVLAGPPSSIYRARKFIRRHRVPVAAALLLFLSLLGGLAARTLEASRANRQAAEAAEARDENGRMLEFLLGLFAAADPAQHEGRELSARDLLDLGAQDLLAPQGDESPRFRARLLNEISAIYWALGDPRAGLELAESALELNRRHLGPQDLETAGTLHLVGTLHSEVGDYGRAEALLREALVKRRAAAGADHPKVADSLVNLGAVQEETSRYEAAAASYDAALRIYRRSGTASDVANVLNNLGVLALAGDRSAEAEGFFREAAEIRERVLGSKHPEVHQAWRNLCESLTHQGRYREALVWGRRALEASEQLLGPDHVEVGHATNNLGHVLKAVGQWRQAEAAYLRTQAIYTEVQGSPDHPWIAYPLTNLGLLYEAEGRLEEAVEAYREAVAIWERHGVDALTAASSRLGLGRSLLAAGRVAEAEFLLMDTAQVTKGVEGAEYLWRSSQLQVGLYWLAVGDYGKARAFLEDALRLSDAERSPSEVWVRAQVGLAKLEALTGETDQAAARIEEALDILRQLPPDRRELLEALALERAISSGELASASQR